MKKLYAIFIPTAFLLLLAFDLYLGNFLEATLYFCLGVGFSIINLTRTKVITKNLPLWSKLSWTFIILSVILFLAVLLNDANNEILGP